MADPLYDLALQAGFFPQPQATPMPDFQQNVGTWDPASLVPPDQAPAPGSEAGMYSGLPDGSMPGTSGYGEVIRAGQVAVPVAPVAEGSRVAAKVKASDRGFDEGKFASASKQDRGLNAQYANEEAAARAAGQPQIDAQVAAAESGVGAANALTKANVDMLYGEGQQANLLRGLQDSFAQDEMKMNMEAQAASDQAKANYMAALADLRASKVDPSQLWGNMSGGMRFGTMVTAFVHDFLGARGIKTSAMDSFNRAIEQNIASQVQAIKTKGEVAEGFKSLWWMQRNQSASDAEARARVRGFLLEGAKQQVIANMSQYKAGLATAQGQAAIAAIDKELANNLVEIHRHIDQNTIARRNQALELHKAKLDAAMRAQALDLQRQQFEYQKRKDEEAKQVSLTADLIPDISESGGGAMRWKFRDGIDDVAKRELLNKVEFTGVMSENVREYREMLRTMDSINDATARTRFMSTNAARMSSLQRKIAMDDVLRRTGKAATDEERKAIESRIPLNTWLTSADTERIAAEFERNGYKDLDAALKTRAIELPKDDPRRQIKGSGGFAEVEAAEANAVAKGTANQLSPEQQDIKKWAGRINGPTSVETADSNSKDAKDALERFDKQNPQMRERLRDDLFPDSPEELEAKYGKGRVNTGVAKLQREAVPNAIDSMTRLADAAAKGNEAAKDQLRQQAAPFLIGGPQAQDDWRGAFAAMLLSEMGETGGYDYDPKTFKYVPAAPAPPKGYGVPDTSYGQ